MVYMCVYLHADIPHMHFVIYINSLETVTLFPAPTFNILGRAVQRELSLLWSPVHREVDDFCCHVMSSESLMLLRALLSSLGKHSTPMLLFSLHLLCCSAFLSFVSQHFFFCVMTAGGFN